MNRIKLLREEKNIFQKDLAKLLDVSVPAINYYENEKRAIDTKTASKLADYFNCSIDYLMGRTNIRNTNASLDLVNEKKLRDAVGKQYLDELIDIKLSPEEQNIFQNIIKVFPINDITNTTTEDEISKKISSYIKNTISSDSKEKIIKKSLLFIEYVLDMSDFEKEILEKNKKIWYEFIEIASNFDIDFKEFEKQVNSLAKINDSSTFTNQLNTYLATLPKQYQSKMNIYIKSLVDYTKNKKINQEEQEFRFAYHKEMEGLSEEEIADALKFYKEMKKRVNKDK